MSKTQLLKDTVVALGGTVDEKDVSSNDLLKKIVVTLGGTPDENSSSEDLMAQMNGLLPDAIGGSGSGSIPAIPTNNQGMSNFYYGAVLSPSTKVKINFKKYRNWVLSITGTDSLNSINNTLPTDTTNSQYGLQLSIIETIKFDETGNRVYSPVTITNHITFPTEYNGYFTVGSTQVPYEQDKTIDEIFDSLADDIVCSDFVKPTTTSYPNTVFDLEFITGVVDNLYNLNVYSVDRLTNLNDHPVDWFEIINE